MTRAIISVKTLAHSELHDITREVEQKVRESGVEEGLCTINIPHTTCGVTINEKADPSVKADILMELDRIVPWQDGYSHLEGNSAGHIKASLMGFSLTLPIGQARLLLGTWQGIYLCEFDGPRSRRVILSIV